MRLTVDRSFFKSRFFWLIAALVVVFLAGLIWYFTQMVDVVIAKPELSYRCIPGKTVFNVLVLSNTVALEETELGPMISSINNLEQGEGKYWSYLIDGQPAPKNAFVTVCAGTEQITWQLK